MHIYAKVPKSLIIFVSDKNKRYNSADFIDIGNRIHAKCDDVKTFIVYHHIKPSEVPIEVWTRPTLSIGFDKKVFTPVRGPFYHNHQVEKLAQAKLLGAAGVAVPHGDVFTPGMTFDNPPWTDILLMKPEPLKLTSGGSGIEIYRREKLAQMKQADFPPDHLIHKVPMIVQNFVDTGEYASRYRAMTLFGEALYVQQTITKKKRPPLDTKDDEALRSAEVHTHGNEREFKHDHHPDIIEFAKKAASVFPSHPLLGIDVIREAETGKLYILEVNAGGNVWHFSSSIWAEERLKNPDVAVTIRKQYDAFNVAADSLIAATRKYAT